MMHHRPSFGSRPSRGAAVVRLALAGCLMGQFHGCASYTASDANAPHAEAMPYVYSDATVSFGADPYTARDRQEQVFGADLVSSGVLPVQVAVVNSSDEVLRIGPDQFKLHLPEEEMTAPRPGQEVAKLFAPTEGVADYATTGAGMLGGLAGPIGAAAGRVVAIISGGALGQSRSAAMQTREADYYRKEFKPTQLGRNQRVHGFLFFVLPRQTPAFQNPGISLNVVREARETATVRLQLRGLFYPGPVN